MARKAASRAVWVTLAGLWVALGGCATAAVKENGATFTIGKDKDACPVSAKMEPAKRNCPTWLVFTKDDCVKVSRAVTVEFRGEPGLKEFTVFFAPYAPLEAKEGRATLRIDPRTPYKEYSFSILAKDCPVLDPSIIVDP